MMVFWLVAVLLIAAALLFVLPPLFRSAADSQAGRRAALNVSIYRDQLTEMARDLDNDVLSQEQYQQGREEIEQRMLDDVGDSNAVADAGRVEAKSRITAIVLAVMMPVVAIALYMVLGTPEGLAPDEYQPPQPTEQQVADQINQMVTRLATRLEGDPTDAEGWKMLGRSYLALERFADARKAFEQAAELLPADAQLLADLADTIAMTSGQSLQGRPMALIEQALKLDPDNQKALWLGGTAAYERQDYRAALGYWQRLYAMQPPGSQGAQAMESNIAEIRGLLGESVVMPALPAGSGGSQAQAVTAGRISGEVRIAAALAGQIKPDDSVFIFAQAPSGPRMPLAVLRATVAELPKQFTLDDSLAMVPEMSLSRYAEVVLTARVSKSGNASPQSGDLQGQTGVISSNNNSGIQLVIDQVIP
jgi:cytochrome c-type biogenesis protein CcmH